MSTCLRLISRTIFAAGVLLVPVLVFSQRSPGIPKNWGTLHFHTNIGSFRFLRPGPRTPAEGKLSFSFVGTVLVSGLDGTLNVTGKVRKEYEDKKHKKVAYFGEGKMVISGKFDTVQWFGRNMNGIFDGAAAVRLYGEFDKNLNTGEYWFENPNQKRYWGTNGSSGTIAVPEENKIPDAKPEGGGG